MQRTKRGKNRQNTHSATCIHYTGTHNAVCSLLYTFLRSPIALFSVLAHAARTTKQQQQTTYTLLAQHTPKITPHDYLNCNKIIIYIFIIAFNVKFVYTQWKEPGTQQYVRTTCDSEQQQRSERRKKIVEGRRKVQREQQKRAFLTMCQRVNWSKSEKNAQNE